MELTPAERTIFRAMTAKRAYGGTGRKDQIVLLDDPSLDKAIEAALRAQSIEAFSSFGLDFNSAFEWAMQVVIRLSEDRVKMPRRYGRLESWSALVDKVRDLVSAQWELDRKDQQDTLNDEGPEALRQWHSQAVAADGTIVDPWGPATSGPLTWFLDNMTLEGVYLIQAAVNKAVQEAVTENLVLWVAGNTEGQEDVPKIAEQTFEKGMDALSKALWAA